MYKTILQVPEGITKISQWTDLENYLPVTGKFILNKKITGCGATTYFLENQDPLILCSHRVQLLECKSESPRHKGLVHLFKNASDTTMEDLSKNMSRLHGYLDSCNPDPFGGSGRIPKILVTTDSLGHVLTVLEERGILEKFTVVSDECQCIFTDVVFKGNSIMNYVNNLRHVSRVVYLSATPYLEKYLKKVPEFMDLPYVELEWPDTVVEEVTLNSYFVKNLKEVLKKKIDFWKVNGYFEENGYHKATEAVFFINSITDILRTIKSLGLTYDQVNIICSKTNQSTLRKLKRAKLKVGDPPKEGEPHKPITFVTKCAYEGVDFYHTNAYTYIFSNPNLENMAMDLSIDVIQILGRQRLDINPWKNSATIFYQTTKDSLKIPREVFDNFQRRKDNFTADGVNKINTTSDNEVRNDWINLFIRDHTNGYMYDYLGIVKDSITGEVRAEPDPLIKIAEERAWDIRNDLYDNKYQVLRNLCQSFNVVQTEVQELNRVFSGTNDFVKRMEYYCEFREAHPELEIEIKGSVTVPTKFHYYYETLGPGKLKTLLYRELLIENEIATRRVTIESPTEFKKKVLSSFEIGVPLLRKDIKSKLQEIYDSFCIKKTAKATDIQEFYNVSETNVVIPSGKRVKGYILVSAK